MDLPSDLVELPGFRHAALLSTRLLRVRSVHDCGHAARLRYFAGVCGRQSLRGVVESSYVVGKSLSLSANF